MRTERAPTTALSGKHISEDALAISTAIFAASYAVPQHDSPDDPGSSRTVSVGSQDGEPMDKATALVDAASAPMLLNRGWIVVRPCFMCSTIGGVGVGGRLPVGLVDDEGSFKKGRIVGARTTKCWSPVPLRCWATWSENLDSGLTRSKRAREYKRPIQNAGFGQPSVIHMAYVQRRR